MNKKYEWKQVYRTQSYGDNSPLKDIPGVAGIEINILTDATLEEMRSLWLGRGVNQIQKEVSEYFVKLSQELIQKKLERRRKFEGAFEKSGLPAVYIEEILNEYWAETDVLERALSPWFICTTKIGHFKVGWRKRVIVLDWSKTDVKTEGRMIFPDYAGTVGDNYIHTNWDTLPEHIATIAKQFK